MVLVQGRSDEYLVVDWGTLGLEYLLSEVLVTVLNCHLLLLENRDALTSVSRGGPTVERTRQKRVCPSICIFDFYEAE